jgi:hypothetical protein
VSRHSAQLHSGGNPAANLLFLRGIPRYIRGGRLLVEVIGPAWQTDL